MASRTENYQNLPAQSVQRSRQLNFNKAMSDFKVMFPSFEYEVIEMVLRANNGLVDATVDQLLAMQESDNKTKDERMLDPELNVRLPSYDDQGATNLEPPPAYTPRVEEDPNFRYDSTFLEPHLYNFNLPVPGQNTSSPRKNHWHPPLLGTLPNDFLRISLDDRPRTTQGDSTENPLYEVSSLQSQRGAHRIEPPRLNQNRPNSNLASRSSINGFDQSFDAIPSQEEEAKSCGKKGKSKRFGQMSRKFKKSKKTKNTKGTTYQQISGDNLIDGDSGDERDGKR